MGPQITDQHIYQESEAIGYGGQQSQSSAPDFHRLSLVVFLWPLPRSHPPHPLPAHPLLFLRQCVHPPLPPAAPADLSVHTGTWRTRLTNQSRPPPLLLTNPEPGIHPDHRPHWTGLRKWGGAGRMGGKLRSKTWEWRRERKWWQN